MEYHIGIWLFFIVASLTLWLVQSYSTQRNTFYLVVYLSWIISLYGIAFSILAGIVKLFLKLVGF